MASLLDILGAPVKAIVDKFVPDASDKLEAQAQFYRLFANADLAQMEVNKQEAAHKSLFVAGWRPFIGWTCGIGLFYSTIVQNILQWACAIWFPDIKPPLVDMTLLTPILTGMLGIGGLRTIEKLKGVARNK